MNAAGPDAASLYYSGVQSTATFGFAFPTLTGNPNLTPESADTINVGAIFETPNFFATVDYWSFDFQDPLVTEAVGGHGCGDVPERRDRRQQLRRSS